MVDVVVSAVIVRRVVGWFVACGCVVGVLVSCVVVLWRGGRFMRFCSAFCPVGWLMFFCECLKA